MKLKSIVGRFIRAITSPTPIRGKISPLRAIARLPVIFDLISFFIQLRDLARLKRIRNSYAVDGDYHRKVHDYNAFVNQNKIITTTRRVEEYYDLIALPKRDMRAENLLIVGPRNVHELVIAWTYGFAWKNIEAIDLYSTNPKIKVMNMEAMTHPDASFDNITMANTLSYADDTRTALKEVARVLKPNGRFAFSATYDPDGSTWKEDSVPAQVIADTMRELGLEIAIHFATDKINSEGRRQTSHAFLARKPAEGEARLDPFKL